MKINKKDILNIDFSDLDIAAQKLKPTVYMDGDSVCCLSGSDPVSGVFGCGSTPAEAVSDWRNSLVTKLNESPRDDEDARRVRKELGIDDKPIGDHVKDFYAQFYPPKGK